MLTEKVKELTRKELNRLREIQDEMWDLNEEALRILRDTSEESRARSYWYAHIQGALNKEGSNYLGGSMCDMEQCISSLEEDYTPEKNEL